jgi:hypothetical protein
VAEPTRVFLHIGAPKTGTTYLQRLLDANREALAGEGVLYPDLGNDAHHTAAWGLRPKSAGQLSSERFADRWDRLVELVTGWPGPSVVVSSEMFVFFGERLAAEVLGAFSEAEVHVVYTARDLLRQVPAVWQEQVKNQKTEGYRAFVTDLLGPRTAPLSRHFWQAQDAPAALGRWSQGLPAHRVHVVTAPPPGAAPTVLWERFASVLGVQPLLAAADSPAANTSLGIAGAEILRRYNARHAAELTVPRYRRTVLRPLMPVLVGGLPDDSRLPLSAAERARIAQLSEDVVAGIRTAGYDVVGSLDDLLVAAEEAGADRQGPGPDDLSDRDLVDALLDVLHEIVESGRLAEPAETSRERAEHGRGRRVRRGRRGAGRRRAGGADEPHDPA